MAKMLKLGQKRPQRGMMAQQLNNIVQEYAAHLQIMVDPCSVGSAEGSYLPENRFQVLGTDGNMHTPKNPCNFESQGDKSDNPENNSPP